MLFKKYNFFLVLLIVALCFNCVTAAKKKKLTPEQQALKNKLRAERKKKSDAADKLIRHTSSDEFKKTVLEDNEHLWVVFYGSRKCPHTQKFNPKWLQFQQNMDSGLYNLENVKVTKIECYGEQLDFCVDQENQYWPELMFYYKGVKKAAYDGEDEIEDIVKYIKKNKDKFMEADKKKTTKSVPAKKPAEKPADKPAKQAKELPAKKPAKNPPKIIPTPKQPPKIEENNVDNAVEDEEIENNIDDNVENAIDDNDNDNDDNYNETEEQTIIDNDVEDPNTGFSHIGIISVGGLAACGLGFVFAKKRFRGHGYSRVGGNDRPQMRYKYNKHIV